VKSQPRQDQEAVTEAVSFKVVLVGEPDVGKSSLLRRFTADIFDNQEAKEVQTKQITVDNGKGKKDVCVSVVSFRELFLLCFILYSSG